MASIPVKLPPYKVINVVRTLSQSQQWGIKQLNVPNTWTVTRGEGITALVIDTGFTTHTDLSGAMQLELSRSFADGEPDPNDCNGHGCVAPDTLIHTNYCGIEPIKTLYDRIPVTEQLQYVSGGIDYVKDIKSLNIKTYALNSATGTTEIASVEHLHRTPLNGMVIDVMLTGNITYQLTPWHVLYTLKHKHHKVYEICKKRADELCSGDRLIYPSGANVGELVKEYPKVRGMVYRQCSYCGHKPNNYKKRTSKCQCKQCGKNTWKEAQEEYFFNEDIAYLTGLVLTDGHITYKGNYRVDITSTTPELLNGAAEICSRYGWKSKIYEAKKPKCPRIIIDSKALADLLISIGVLVKGKTYKQKVPEIVGKSPKTVMESFIAGVLDGDGCISKTNTKNRITTVSKDFAWGTAALLNSLGISCGVQKYKNMGFDGNTPNLKVPIFNCTLSAITPSISSLLRHPIKQKRASIAPHHFTKARCVKSIKKVNYVGDYYDFTVANHHTYLANGHFLSNTHCCGIVGARDNTIGVVGVAPACNIVTAKVLGGDGSGTMDTVNAGLRYAIELKPDVVSMSLGSPTIDVEMHELIKQLYAMNIPVVCAAGNDGPGLDTVNYPGRFNEVITVGAFDSNGNIADFSSTGPGVDVAAPGVDIYSTWLNNGYAKISGTSMATPFITGLICLLLAKHRKQQEETGLNDCITVDQIKEHLYKYTDDKGIVGKDDKWGYGVIDPSKLIYEDGTVTMPTQRPTWWQRFLLKVRSLLGRV